MKNRRAHLGIEAKLDPFFICLDFVHLNEDPLFAWANSQNVQADEPSPCSMARLQDVHKVLIHRVPGEEQSPPPPSHLMFSALAKAVWKEREG